VIFDGTPDWHTTEVSHLWRYHLHYFDYVHDLLVWATVGYADRAYAAFRTLATSWIDANQTFDGDGWNPYTLSLRLVNWLYAVDGFAPYLHNDPEFRRQLLGSIYGQAQIVWIDRELDLRGNHLVENIRALLWAGVAFEGAEPAHWFQRSLSLLQHEVAEQILPDGGHFERTPGYHLVVLRDILEIAILLQRNNHSVPGWLDDAINRMLNYLLAILPPDGRVPLLKDTAWDVVPEVDNILAAGAFYCNNPVYKRSTQVGLYPLLLYGAAGMEVLQNWPVNQDSSAAHFLPESGYCVLRNNSNDDYLILDVGKPCPDYLPAHAHADLLSYELLVGGERLIVDAGVYEYASGPWRDFFRSTRAHNTVELNGTNQSEVWSSFRVGRRARPGPVSWHREETFILVQGEHDGYRFLPAKATHKRTVAYLKQRCWLIVDTIWGKRKGTTALANHIHFHPQVSLEPTDAATWSLRGIKTPVWLNTFGHDEHTQICGSLEPVRQGWHSEEFGQMVPAITLQLAKRTDLPTCCGYCISQQSPVRGQIVAVEGGYHVHLHCGEQRYTLEIYEKESPRFS